MKPPFRSTILIGLLWGLLAQIAHAEVTVTELEDRIRFEIDGQLFTEWRHEEWFVPYLYPVIGPNGESVTRHYPMKTGVEGEQTDHDHHRSIRFSHKPVNGFSFWAPQSGRDKSRADIKLEKIEKLTSGEKGELIVWNRWLGDDELVLRERLRLAVTPLENGEVLLDYDVELHAGDEPVVFGDQKDGGLGIRVAGSMKVTDRKTGEGEGKILTATGEADAEAWGVRAKWASAYGPDASGKVVGIAVLDHPTNVRYPTWWHARTYGLMAANRFGTGYFEKANGAEIGDGEFTLPAGEVLKLRHRLYFHHGDPTSADVESRHAEYSRDEGGL